MSQEIRKRFTEVASRCVARSCGAAAVVAIATSFALPATAATLVVDDDGTYDAATQSCDGSDAAYTSIVTAVGDAIDGDTVFVCPGTYHHPQIIVDKRITLQGSGADVTTIDGGGGFLALPAYGMVRLVPVAGTGDVVFDGFTLQNPPARNTEGGLRVGIAPRSAFDVNIIVTNNVIIGSGNSAHSSNFGMYAEGPIGPAPVQPLISTLIFQHNEIRDTGSNPILIERHVGPTDVSYNTFDNGVAAAGASAYFNMSHTNTTITGLHRVSHNTINLANPMPSSTAIAFVGAFTGTSIGNFQNVEITNNTIINVGPSRRGINVTNNISSLENTANGVIENLVISCNSISGPGSIEAGSIGIRLAGNIPSPTITNNRIDFVNTGFQAFNMTNGVASNVTLNENSFTNTGAYAVDWRSTEVIDAELNWWGSDTGPTDPANPGGAGGVIGAGGGPVGSGVIDFSPWLASGDDDDAGPCFVPGGAAECRTVGTCDEIDGCTDSPAPDGTICGGGSFTCSGGICATGLSPIVLSRANIKVDNGKVRPNGRVAAVALINDNDTNGTFQAAVLSNAMTVRVTDSADFDAERTLTNCVARKLFLRCRSADLRTRALFRFQPRGPYLYTLRLTMTGLTAAQTGGPNPVGPLTVTLDQNPGTRSDVIGDFAACTPRGRNQLWCREN